jgi:hypothetical protein
VQAKEKIPDNFHIPAAGAAPQKTAIIIAFHAKSRVGCFEAGTEKVTLQCPEADL